MIEFKKISEDSGENCAVVNYEVELHEQCTVSDFVSYVLSRGDSKGVFQIYGTDRGLTDYDCDKYEYEYECGKLKDEIPSEIMNKKIRCVEGHGGCILRDYKRGDIMDVQNRCVIMPSSIDIYVW